MSRIHACGCILPRREGRPWGPIADGTLRLVSRSQLVEERMRAEISVKLHLATGGKVGHRQCLEDAFRASDHDGDGSIDFSEFCATAAAIGLGVSESELKSAFSRFDVNGDSTIEFAEVVDFMCPRVKTARDAQREVHVQHLERMVGERAPLELNDATEEAVHQGVRRIAQTVHGKEINLRNAFRQWDKDGSGALDVNEFVAALNSLGFSLDLADAQARARTPPPPPRTRAAVAALWLAACKHAPLVACPSPLPAALTHRMAGSGTCTAVAIRTVRRGPQRQARLLGICAHVGGLRS